MRPILSKGTPGGASIVAGGPKARKGWPEVWPDKAIGAAAIQVLCCGCRAGPGTSKIFRIGTFSLSPLNPLRLTRDYILPTYVKSSTDECMGNDLVRVRFGNI